MEMENRILRRLEGRLGAQPDVTWLLTLFTVLPLDTYTLPEWNEALSAALGRRILCPSYRVLNEYLHRAWSGPESRGLTGSGTGGMIGVERKLPLCGG